ncbi:MAG: hypothetical protein WCT08_02690 [Patescibacteria group bacterium]
MFCQRAPQKSIKLSVIWLAIFVILAGILAATYGPKSIPDKVSSATDSVIVP